MQMKDLVEINKTRKLAGLPLISVKSRACNICQRPFRSFGDRTCPECSKTKKKVAATYCGRQLY